MPLQHDFCFVTLQRHHACWHIINRGRRAPRENSARAHATQTRISKRIRIQNLKASQAHNIIENIMATLCVQIYKARAALLRGSTTYSIIII